MGGSGQISPAVLELAGQAEYARDQVAGQSGGGAVGVEDVRDTNLGMLTGGGSNLRREGPLQPK